MSNFLYFADDWGRHPSSSQYLAAELARQHRITWVNTIGMRRPRFDSYTFHRGFEKLKQWFTSTPLHLERDNIQVTNPIQLPWWGNRLCQRINTILLVRHLLRFMRRDRCSYIGVSALPLPPEWLERLPVKGWIYYCVDNFRDWPGLEGDLLREFEAYLIRRAVVIIAVSEVLAQWIASLGRTSFLLSHGIDLRIWTHPSIRGSPSRYSISRPSVVWWGLIDERLDWDWLTYAAESLSNVHFNLAGRIYFVPPAISRYNNIHFLGQIPAHDLPGLAQSADVLMMPYVDSPVTRAMQPLKMLEYLASGKPIVGRRLPALSRWQDWVLLAHDKYEFVAALRTALVRKPSAEELARRWACLRAHSWTAKAEQFLEWVRQAGLIN